MRTNEMENQAEEQIDAKIKNVEPEKKEEMLQNFERFKDFLGDKVEKADKIGLSEEKIAQGAEKVANYLAKREEPRNREEYLLQQMWQVADKDQQHQLAHILVNLARTTN